MLQPPAKQAKLKLTGHQLYPKSGIMMLEYAVDYATPKPKARTRRGKAPAKARE
jgi:hypothetical protein